MDPKQLSAASVTLAGGKKVTGVLAPPGADPRAVAAALGLSGADAVIILAGSTKNAIRKRLGDLLNRGVTRAAGRAIIIDDGTSSSAGALVGEVAATTGKETPLVGVAPAANLKDIETAANGHVSGNLDSQHNTHFALLESNQRTDATEMMFALAAELAKGQATAGSGPLPVITVLAGDDVDGQALNEALFTVRRKWPLVVLSGTGDLCQLLDRLYNQRKRITGRKRSGYWRALSRLPGLGGLTRFSAPSASLQEIIEDGQLMVFPASEDAAGLKRKLAPYLAKPQPDDLLMLAWRRFADFDLNSVRHQRLYRTLKEWPIRLGVISTAVVLASSVPQGQPLAGALAWLQTGVAKDIARVTIILLPIIVTLFLAIDTRFKSASKYILLRQAAESVKRGIYSYRALYHLPPDPSSPAGGTGLPATPAELASYLQRIDQTLMGSDANESALVPYAGPIPPPMFGAGTSDDGVSPFIKADDYVHIRLDDQVSFYSSRSNTMEQRLRRLQLAILTLGSAGAFLAAIDWQYWLPVTAAWVTALTALIEYQQLEQVLVKYNFTKGSLEDLRGWWRSLSDSDRADANNIRHLVRETEALLESEISGWVRYLKEAQQQKPPAEAPEPTAPPSQTPAVPSGPGGKGVPAAPVVTPPGLAPATVDGAATPQAPTT